MVTMAHPDLLVTFGEPAIKDIQPAFRRDKGTAELGGAVAAFDLAAQLVHHHLLAVTDAQDRHAIVENLLRGAGRALARDAVRPAREDHGTRRHLAHEIHRDILIGVNLAINIQFAQAACDQLRYLAAEVDDQKAVMGVLGHAWLLGRKPCMCKRYDVN